MTAASAAKTRPGANTRSFQLCQGVRWRWLVDSAHLGLSISMLLRRLVLRSSMGRVGGLRMVEW